MQLPGALVRSSRPRRSGGARWTIEFVSAGTPPAADARSVRQLPLRSGIPQLSLTQAERWQLESFRRAASEVREASIIAEGQRIQVRRVPRDGGEVDVVVDLLQNETFRSLALAIRLVYQQGEPAHFYSICNLLARKGGDLLRAEVGKVRAAYQESLSDSAGHILIEEGSVKQTFNAQAVLEHWLYGVAFHQDDVRQQVVQLLAGRILDLDDLVADFLSEPRLPRI